MSRSKKMLYISLRLAMMAVAVTVFVFVTFTENSLRATPSFIDTGNLVCVDPVPAFFWQTDPCLCEQDPTCALGVETYGTDACKGPTPMTKAQCKAQCTVPKQWKFNSDGCFPYYEIGDTITPGDAETITFMGGDQPLNILFSDSRDSAGFGEGNETNPSAIPCPSSDPGGLSGEGHLRYMDCNKDFPSGDGISIAQWFGNDFASGELTTTRDCIDGIFVGTDRGTDGCPWYTQMNVVATLVKGANLPDDKTDKIFQGLCQKRIDTTNGNTPDLTQLVPVPSGSTNFGAASNIFEDGRVIKRYKDPAHTGRYIFYRMDLWVDAGVPRDSTHRVRAGGVEATSLADIETMSKFTMSKCFENYTEPGVDRHGQPTGTYVDKNAASDCYLACAFSAAQHQPCTNPKDPNDPNYDPQCY